MRKKSPTFPEADSNGGGHTFRRCCSPSITFLMEPLSADPDQTRSPKTMLANFLPALTGLLGALKGPLRGFKGPLRGPKGPEEICQTVRFVSPDRSPTSHAARDKKMHSVSAPRPGPLSAEPDPPSKTCARRAQTLRPAPFSCRGQRPPTGLAHRARAPKIGAMPEGFKNMLFIYF